MIYPNDKIICLIPARSNSKRIKHKNIKLLNGKPLLSYSIETALKLFKPKSIIVTSDSSTILSIAQRYDVQSLLRPKRLATDHSTDYDVIEHALLAHPSDYVAYLRPTTPFRRLSICKQALNLALRSKTSTGLRSIELMEESAFKCFTLRKQYLQPIEIIRPRNNSKHNDSYQTSEKVIGDLSNMPNQLVTPTYRGNGYFDVVKAGAMERYNLFGNKCLGFLTPPVIELDTPEQWEYAEWWVRGRVPFSG